MRAEPVTRPGEVPERLAGVRVAVRELLSAAPGFRAIDPVTREALARGLVRICFAAATLADEQTEGRAASAPLAMAQAATARLDGAAADRVGSTTRSILNAVSFPRFVTELINGVFKAMVDTSIQQMASYVDLINNVGASLGGFADTNVGLDRARRWLADTYPGSYEVAGDDPDAEAEPGDEPPELTVRLRSGASAPSDEVLRTGLGLPADAPVPSGDPERVLVPVVRSRLAAMRQASLATMVLLGMQRIVVDSGRITAAMRFHIDTRSAAQAGEGSTFDMNNQVTAAGSYGAGPWGVSGSISNTIGYVSTQQSQSTEELNTDLELSSSVEINFRTDQVPLDRMAGRAQADRIRDNSLNPEAEAEAAAKSRVARTDQARTEESNQRSDLGKRLAPRGTVATPEAGGAADARKLADTARREAAKESAKKDEPAVKA